MSKKTTASKREVLLRASRFSLLFCTALVTLLPLAFDPGGYFIFLPIKWTIALSGVLAGLGALSYGARFRPVFKFQWALLLGAVFLAAAFAESSWTVWIGSPGRHLGLLAWVVFAGAFWLGVSSTEDERSVERVIRAAAVTSVIAAVYGLAQLMGIDPLNWDAHIDVTRSRSTFGNAAFLGAYLALMVPVTTRLALSSSLGPRVRAVYVVSALTGSSALLATQTRGAWVGVGVAFAVMVFRERSRLIDRPKLLATGLSLIAIATAALFAFTPLGARLTSIADPSSGTARGRLIQWDLTLKMIQDRPLLGYGPDAYEREFPRFVSRTFERTAGRTQIPDRAHNAVLDIAVASGMLGLVAYAWLVFSVFRKGLGSESSHSALHAGVLASLLAYVIQQQFLFPLADVDVLFWLFAGLLFAGSPAVATTKAFAVSRWPLLLAAVAALVWGGREVVADRYLRNGLNAEAAGRDAATYFRRAGSMAPERIQFAQAASRFHRRRAESSGSLQDLKLSLGYTGRAESFANNDPELDLDRADTLLTWAEISRDPSMFQQAERSYQKLLEFDHNSSRVWLKLGVAYADQNKLDQAIETWLRAADLAPKSPGPVLNLATAYERRGDEDKAIRAYRRVLQLDPNSLAARRALARLQ